jgi:hypothetical protein
MNDNFNIDYIHTQALHNYLSLSPKERENRFKLLTQEERGIFIAIIRNTPSHEVNLCTLKEIHAKLAGRSSFKRDNSFGASITRAVKNFFFDRISSKDVEVISSSYLRPAVFQESPYKGHMKNVISFLNKTSEELFAVSPQNQRGWKLTKRGLELTSQRELSSVDLDFCKETYLGFRQEYNPKTKRYHFILPKSTANLLFFKATNPRVFEGFNELQPIWAKYLKKCIYFKDIQIETTPRFQNGVDCTVNASKNSTIFLLKTIFPGLDGYELSSSSDGTSTRVSFYPHALQLYHQQRKKMKI